MFARTTKRVFARRSTPFYFVRPKMTPQLGFGSRVFPREAPPASSGGKAGGKEKRRESVEVAGRRRIGAMMSATTVHPADTMS